jgi:hypothetical protein
MESRLRVKWVERLGRAPEWSDRIQSGCHLTAIGEEKLLLLSSLVQLRVGLQNKVTKEFRKLSVVILACNSSIQEAEAGGS